MFVLFLFFSFYFSTYCLLSTTSGKIKMCIIVVVIVVVVAVAAAAMSTEAREVFLSWVSKVCRAEGATIEAP